MEEDIVVLALTLYRECRGEPRPGQVAVANVIANRVKRDRIGFYRECVKPLQFSSITAKGDSQLTVWPDLTDPAYLNVKNISRAAVNGDLPDTTNGCTLYYNPKSIATGKVIAVNGVETPFPSGWNANRVDVEGYIGNHIFMREV